MTLALSVIGVMAGLGLGLWWGWRGGAWVVGFPDRYWTLNAAAFLGCMLLDLAGLFVHQPWLSYGSLGLMAGLITGLKYGYSPQLRLWEPQPPRPPAEDEDAGALGDPGAPGAAEAPGDAGASGEVDATSGVVTREAPADDSADASGSRAPGTGA